MFPTSALGGILTTTVPLSLRVTQDSMHISMILSIQKFKKASLTSKTEEDMECNSHKFLETVILPRKNK